MRQLNNTKLRVPKNTKHPYPPVNQSVYFIHTPKVAGTSIGIALGIYKTHDPASFIKASCRQRWHVVKIFTVIRNPWDHALSWFLYNGAFREKYETDKAGFNRWVLDGMDSNFPGSRGASVIFQEEYIEISGECQAQFIVRFENLEEGWVALQKWLGIETDPPRLLPHHDPKPSVKPDYREWWTQEARDYAEPKFAYFSFKYGYNYGDEPGHITRRKNGPEKSKTGN